MSAKLPFSASAEDDVELVIADVGVARAFWEGVPAARLLARVRVDRDQGDLVDAAERASGVDLADSTWDTLMARLLGRTPAALDRVKRSVARHTRAASDEGRLRANDAAIAALTHVLLSASDPDASPAEGAAEALAIDDNVRRACGLLDERLGAERADRRAAAFEACLHLALQTVTAPLPLDAFAAALDAIAGASPAVVAATAPLYPWGEQEVLVAERRACLLERGDLERALVRPERELAAAVARAAGAHPIAEKAVSEVTQALARRGATLLFVVAEPRSVHDAPPVQPSSWLPSDFASHDAAQRLASALERGATTVPRARAVLARGGDAALDAVGKEMLEVAAHPFASSVFAEMLAAVGRERDVVRLVTYFAIAPDPSPAARALSLCTARDVPSMLRAWLESMLPADGGLAAPDADPEAPGSRLAACLAALEPYPALYAAVRPLLARVSEMPPGPSRD